MIIRNSRKGSIALILIISLIISLIPSAAAASVENNGSSDELNSVTAVNEESASEKIFDNDSAENNDGSLLPAATRKMGTKSFVLDDEVGDFISWQRKNNFTLYQGEKLYTKFKMYDAWKNYHTIPAIAVFKNGESTPFYAFAPSGSALTVTENSYNIFYGYHNIDSKYLSAGSYRLLIYAMPCYSNGKWVDNFQSFNIPVEVVSFKIKKLLKPTNVKLIAGKNNVTISFKKVTGAQKYEIYRSTKKNSGYKKIATVSGTRYVNKGLVKGKRYYYKVRARRGNKKAGIAYSKFTDAKLSGRVR